MNVLKSADQNVNHNMLWEEDGIVTSLSVSFENILKVEILVDTYREVTGSLQPCIPT